MLEADAQTDIDRLTHKLRNDLAAYTGTCLLVADPSLRELEDNPDRGAFFSKANRVSVPVRHVMFPPEHQPQLIELDLTTEAGVALLQESVSVALADRHPDSVARGHGQRVGGWLAGASSLQDVLNHWAEILVQTDNSNLPRLLRFYDARVLDLMWPVLSPTQRRGLLGPVQAWHALDACAQPTAYIAPGRTGSWMRINDAQWVAFHQHGIVNRALALFMYDVKRQPTRQEVDVAVQSAARAEGYGLWDRQDKVTFVGHALAWHPWFDLYPAVASALEKVSQGTMYSAAVSELAPRAIEDIRQGNWFETVRKV